MTAWAEIAIIFAWTLASFAGGCYVTTKFEEVDQARALQAQIQANQKAVQEANDRAADLEKELIGERQKESQNIQKMEATIAKLKNLDDCPVPSGIIRLCNQTIAPAGHSTP